jgi:hypothetical protein
MVFQRWLVSSLGKMLFTFTSFVCAQRNEILCESKRRLDPPHIHRRTVAVTGADQNPQRHSFRRFPPPMLRHERDLEREILAQAHEPGRQPSMERGIDYPDDLTHQIITFVVEDVGRRVAAEQLGVDPQGEGTIPLPGCASYIPQRGSQCFQTKASPFKNALVSHGRMFFDGQPPRRLPLFLGDAGAFPGDGRDPLQLENGRSEFFRKPLVLGFEAAYMPVKLFVFAEDPADLLESAGALMHTSPLQKRRRRAELGERRMYHVPGFVAELVRVTAGAPNRNQGLTSSTNPPFPGAR